MASESTVFHSIKFLEFLLDSTSNLSQNKAIIRNKTTTSSGYHTISIHLSEAGVGSIVSVIVCVASRGHHVHRKEFAR